MTKDKRMPTSEYPVEGTQYRVVDADGFRLLLVKGNDNSAISLMPLAAPDALVAPYTAAMLMPLPFLAQPKDIVLIGLGGGQQAKFIYNRLPRTRLVAVEIDPDIVRIARSHFSVPEDDEKLSVVTGDGGKYIQAHPDSCDLILSDGYDQTFSIADTLAGEQFYRACHRALRPGGMMAINLFDHSTAWLDTHLRMVRSIFSADIQLEIAHDQIVLLLAKDPLHESRQVLAARAKALEAKLDLGLSRFVQRFEEERRAAASAADAGRLGIVIKDLKFGLDALLAAAAKAA